MRSCMHRPTLFLFCFVQETENHPVPWASSSSSNNNMKTWTVCMDSVSLPHHHNRDLYHLNYQTHLTELISTPPTVSLNTNGLFLWVFVSYSETQAYSHAFGVQYNIIGLWPYECKLAWMYRFLPSLVDNFFSTKLVHISRLYIVLWILQD